MAANLSSSVSQHMQDRLDCLFQPRLNLAAVLPPVPLQPSLLARLNMIKKSPLSYLPRNPGRRQKCHSLPLRINRLRSHPRKQICRIFGPEFDKEEGRKFFRSERHQACLRPKEAVTINLYRHPPLDGRRFRYLLRRGKI